MYGFTHTNISYFSFTTYAQKKKIYTYTEEIYIGKSVTKSNGLFRFENCTLCKGR